LHSIDAADFGRGGGSNPPEGMTRIPNPFFSANGPHPAL
jgi:hypothetical protein